MKNLFNYLFMVAVAASIIGIVWAWNESNEIRNHQIEKERIENILEERRNKIDSLENERLKAKEIFYNTIQNNNIPNNR